MEEDALQQQTRQRQLKSKKMLKLMESDLFQELIINDFIKEGILEQTLHMGLNSDNTIDQLKARQILHEYLFGIIQLSA